MILPSPQSIIPINLHLRGKTTIPNPSLEFLLHLLRIAKHLSRQLHRRDGGRKLRILRNILLRLSHHQSRILPMLLSDLRAHLLHQSHRLFRRHLSTTLQNILRQKKQSPPLHLLLLIHKANLQALHIHNPKRLNLLRNTRQNRMMKDNLIQNPPTLRTHMMSISRPTLQKENPTMTDLILLKIHHQKIKHLLQRHPIELTMHQLPDLPRKSHKIHLFLLIPKQNRQKPTLLPKLPLLLIRTPKRTLQMTLQKIKRLLLPKIHLLIRIHTSPRLKIKNM